MEYFPCLSSKCDICKNQISHMFDVDRNHLTCIGYLMNFGSVCCKIGFENLLAAEKDIHLCIDNPPFISNRCKMLQICYKTPIFIDEDLEKDCQIILLKHKIDCKKTKD